VLVSPYSTLWPRVAHLKPRLRTHAQLHRQQFRGQTWYVIQDHATSRFHRFTPAVHHLIALMDGHRTLQEIWDEAGPALGEDLPTQDEVIQLLAQMHLADLLHVNVPPDVADLSRRMQAMRRRMLFQSFSNPLAVRVPLVDPDRFLSRTLPYMAPLFGWFGLLLWCTVVGLALILVGLHWSELTRDITDRVLSVDNLLVTLVTFPVIKALHELSHGYATKRWGGEVHEIGVMFLVFLPIPYVDASAAAAFRDKWKRALVGAAGIFAELFMAALAMIVWVNVEPGMARAVAFNVLLIGSLSSLLFNGNPLLRYDGYYVLSDLSEIPNLGIRASQYLTYLAQRYLFGLEQARSPVSAPGEARWFFFYGIASFIYRMFVWAAIILVVASKFFFVGVVLALWGVALMFIRPLGKGLAFLFIGRPLAGRRTRALAVSTGVLALVALLLFALPVPYSTVLEGVVWVPQRSLVHAGSDGFVRAVEAVPNRAVAEGAPLVTLEDPILRARAEVLRAQLRELELVYEAQRVEDLVEAEITREQAAYVRARLERAEQELAGLTVASPAAGTFLLPRAEDMVGRFVRKGEQIGYVVEPGSPLVRVVVPQDEVDLVRQHTRGVAVRLANAFGEHHRAVVTREVPAAQDQLPSRALSTEGGGRMHLDPSDPTGRRTLERLFHLELRLDSELPADYLGERAYVRFEYEPEPVAWRWARQIRQVFLRRFSV